MVVILEEIRLGDVVSIMGVELEIELGIEGWIVFFMGVIIVLGLDPLMLTFSRILDSIFISAC